MMMHGLTNIKRTTWFLLQDFCVTELISIDYNSCLIWCLYFFCL